MPMIQVYTEVDCISAKIGTNLSDQTQILAIDILDEDKTVSKVVFLPPIFEQFFSVFRRYHPDIPNLHIPFDGVDFTKTNTRLAC